MPTTDNAPLTRDMAYELLSNKRRRCVISRLRDSEGAVSVETLASELAACEYDIPESELTDTQIKRLYVSLYQIHLPKLADVGLVEYDKEQGQVQLTSMVSTLDGYLPQQETPSSGWKRWQVVYMALTAVAIALYVDVLLVGAVFTWLPVAVLNSVVAAALLVVTVTHYLLVRR